MSDNEWFMFFMACARILGPGHRRPREHGSWCAWTTFSSLQEEVHYWSAGLPLASELTPVGITDAGTWGQPFPFRDIAHVIIPRKVYWELTGSSEFRHGFRLQDIERLSRDLTAVKVLHRLTELVLEIKLY